MSKKYIVNVKKTDCHVNPDNSVIVKGINAPFNLTSNLPNSKPMQSNNKTTITIKAYGRKVRITIQKGEPTIEQLSNTIRDAVIALGYAQQTVTKHLGDFS